MKNVNTLNALSRKTVGSNSSRKVKNSEKIPAIIYGNGLNPEPVSLNVSELRKEVNNSTFLNKIYDLLVEKNKVRVIVQGVEQDPVTDELIHVDFELFWFNEELETQGNRQGNTIYHFEKP